MVPEDWYQDQAFQDQAWKQRQEAEEHNRQQVSPIPGMLMVVGSIALTIWILTNLL